MSSALWTSCGSAGDRGGCAGREGGMEGWRNGGTDGGKGGVMVQEDLDKVWEGDGKA